MSIVTSHFEIDGFLFGGRRISNLEGDVHSLSLGVSCDLSVSGGFSSSLLFLFMIT